MTDVLFGLLGKPDKLEELANLALRRTGLFSWKKAADETINVYKS